MERIVTGLFGDHREAELVVEHLVQECGVPRDRLRLHAREEGGGVPPRDPGLPWDVLAAHAEGLGRGGVLLAAWVEPGQLQQALQAFREYGAASPTAHAVETPEPAGVPEDELRLRAYYLWENAGRPAGRDLEFWDRACREAGVVATQGDLAARAPRQFAGETGAAPLPEREQGEGG